MVMRPGARMSIASLPLSRPRDWVTPLFALTVFASAALVFMVEPMIARLILPALGGSPAVWNTSMAFFQLALLAGYVYAHLLQRIGPATRQIFVHLGLLALAALTLPIEVTQAFGAPPVGTPSLWLLGVLIVSIGAPFAMLSATAPLLQAWYARAGLETARTANPYVLYAASNIGSMLALLAYPAIVEPFLPVHMQTLGWTLGYGVFALLVAGVGLAIARSTASAHHPHDGDARHLDTATAPAWRERLLWLALSAAPSSLMLATTTYLSNDVVSAPFLWVLPLALYLLTFIIAFQAKPLIGRERALLWQGVFAAMAAGLLCVNTTSLVAHLFTYTGAFFFSALVCHQRLAATKPGARHLTEFYLLLSLGGVIGGAFNAFLAPVVFSRVVEFQLVLVLTLLARPRAEAPLSARQPMLAFAGVVIAAAIAFMPDTAPWRFVPVALAIAGGVTAGLVSGRPLLFAIVAAALCGESVLVPPDRHADLFTARSFFGVHRVTRGFEPALGGEVHLLFHGTTIHGAQSLSPAQRCTATTYYAPPTPIGQAYANVLARHPGARIGVVGLGAGTVATYTRAADTMRFFEIDPDVARIARDPRYFSYLSGCAKGAVDIVLGDARLTLAGERAGAYDLLQLDAFSADNVPAHLLTVEAFRLYLRALKPDGVILLHLTNRNLSLEAPAAAAAKEVGAVALMQEFEPKAGVAALAAAPTHAMLVAKSPAALAAFAHDKRWRRPRDNGVRAWSDDYTNLLGALIAHAQGR